MTILHARESTVKFSTSAISIATTGPIDADFTGSAEGQVKDLTITPPEGTVEKIDFLGETSGFQNAIYNEGSFGIAKVSGTLTMSGDEQIIAFMGGSSGTSVTGGYTRYQFGLSTATKTRQTTGAILLNLENGSEELSFVLNNVMFTKIGDVKATGTDGHWEVAFEAECLPSNFYWEVKN